MKKKIIIWLVILIVGSNLPIINKEILRNVDAEHFRYSNADASFTYKDHFGFKTGGYINRKVSERKIRRVKKYTHDNVEIFRLYKINPLCFWRWSYYLTVSKQFEYKSWQEIAPNRVPYEPIANPLQRF